MSGRGRASSSESDSNSHQPTAEKRLTICVVGSGSVGKSSLTVRYLQGHFPEVLLKIMLSDISCSKYVSSIKIIQMIESSCMDGFRDSRVFG